MSLELSDEEVLTELSENGIDCMTSKLKTLHMQYSARTNIPCTILTYFPMLEYLHVDERFCMAYRTNQNWEQVYELDKARLTFAEKMEAILEKNNLWKVLPFLKEIKFKTVSSREGHFPRDYFSYQVFQKPFCKK